MIKHIKRLLGIGQEPVATAPYKVETPAETAVSKPADKPADKPAKKPAVKAKTAAKPRKPKAPKG